MSRIANLIPESLAKSIPAIGLRLVDDTFFVGLSNKLEQKKLKEITELLKKELKLKINPVLMDINLINQNLELEFQKVQQGENPFGIKVNPRPDSSIIELVDKTLETALRLRASDIHIEPLVDKVVIRMRIDGILEEIANFGPELCPAIVSRIKVLSKLSIVERRKPQDGQFSVKILERELDIRVSTVATLYGEKVALRILDTHQNLGPLESLGMRSAHLKSLEKFIQGRHGLLLSAGPTGSGKTTTMHSTLKMINSSSLNVCTIEDPVEYVIPGINHLPVNDSIGLTFATQLRAILRQDPDVVLVGEIRDAETARIAVQAALAGRLVLSTLHAPNAIGAIYRLFQMGIEPYQVAASLVGVVSQRLLRRNCIFCIEEFNPNSVTREHIKKLSGNDKLNLKKGAGCTLCRQSGFFDRIGAFQVLEIDETIREIISQRPSPVELERSTRKFGLKTLDEEALLLAVDGHTSLDEIAELELNELI